MVKLHFLIRILSFSVLVFSMIACNSDVRKEANDCPKGAPMAVYNSDYDFVISHDFQLDGQNSTEKIIFTDSLQLTIRQSGCENIYQSYIFTFKGDYQALADTSWLDMAGQAFYKLGSFEEKFYVYNLWANKIQEHKAEFKLTEAFQAEPRIYIKIDRILSESEADLVIDLYEE